LPSSSSILKQPQWRSTASFACSPLGEVDLFSVVVKACSWRRQTGQVGEAKKAEGRRRTGCACRIESL
jgi:hypothetical protein